MEIKRASFVTPPVTPRGSMHFGMNSLGVGSTPGFDQADIQDFLRKLQKSDDTLSIPEVDEPDVASQKSYCSSGSTTEEEVEANKSNTNSNNNNNNVSEGLEKGLQTRKFYSSLADVTAQQMETLSDKRTASFSVLVDNVQSPSKSKRKRTTQTSSKLPLPDHLPVVSVHYV